MDPAPEPDELALVGYAVEAVDSEVAQEGAGNSEESVGWPGLAAARARRARGQSVTQIAREFGVGRSALYRALGSPVDNRRCPGGSAVSGGYPDWRRSRCLPRMCLRATMTAWGMRHVMAGFAAFGRS
ncbi:MULTISPECIES: helix-turn-helix domain-containing protein [Nonomuraea]|uniref:helix-turn-helix domain-containing protein n=1 Tax=Nonomuraea TaxID=83681 RepID=UPI0034471A98